MKRLLNISTHPSDLQTIGHDRGTARDFCLRNGFDGYELYPVDGYDFERIPADIIIGLHLRFFPILAPMWRADHRRLLEIFGDQETMEAYYGGRDGRAIVDTYLRQLALAERLDCEYVVFHAAQCDLESVHSWRCSWTWQETARLCAEVIDTVMRESTYTGEILFENLWWPGSMRLDSADEAILLFQRLQDRRCGLVLDTGHVLNKDQRIRSEAEGIDYLLHTVRELHELAHLIRAVHLTRSLSADYVVRFRSGPSPFRDGQTFWQRFAIAHRHVQHIDQHDAFEHPGVKQIVDLLSPAYLVYEFSYRDMAEWQTKIDRRNRALAGMRHAG